MNPNRISLKIKRLTPTAILPVYGTSDAAGMDLHADIAQQLIIGPGERATIPTGIAMALPSFLALFVCPRSGLSSKSGITVHNGPGVIDGDYRGGLGVILHNTTHQQFVVKPGDRIAQGVIVPVFQADFDEVEELDETDRGTGGFGSTGVTSVLSEQIALPSGKPMSVNAVIGFKALAQQATDRRRALPPEITRWVEAEPRELHPEDAQ